MTIGIAILLIAVGAILRYAVTITIEGVELDTVGLILMITGIIGLVIALAVTFMASDRRSPDEHPTRRY
jgi:heme/copper-type cytochrome/quinol oxidase subunit 2